MECPLCGGPLRLDEAGHFSCERGHHLAGRGEAEQAAASRVTIALWMAIEALDSEAEILRALAQSSDDAAGLALAEQAAQDAKLLRSLASARTGSARDSEGGHGR